MNKILVISILVLLFTQQSSTATIIPFGTDKSLNKESIKIDNTDCITGNCYSAWLNVNVPEKDNQVGHYESLHQFNCSNKSARIKRLMPYDKQGNLLADIPSYNNSWHTVIPKSDESLILNYVCSYETIKKDDTELYKINPNKQTSSKALTSTDIYRNNVNSMVYITTDKKQGSGVIVKDDGTLITCFHVIANANYIKIESINGEKYNVTGFKYINPLEDIAILIIDTPKNFKPIKINTSELNIGDKVYTISNPEGLQFSFSDGLLSQKTNEYLQFTAPISQGSSGGALLNKEGALIGIITSTIFDGQNLNIALPNNYYIDKINNLPIKNIYNKNWTDFIVDNANTEQIKLLMQYHLKSKEHFLQLYSSLKPFTKRSDFPKNYYSMIGYTAMLDEIKNEDFTFKESIYWFTKSLNCNLHRKLSLFSLYILYFLSGDKINCEKYGYKLNEEYPQITSDFFSSLDSIQTINDKNKRIEEFFKNVFSYTADLLIDEYQGEFYN